ncbi:hypothetical protein V493_07921 [Pseudogymnoascus sp. VKM F-4281 (FW-2241)]|nr:hypothetical protein V493_07921 [Pseudogymnoascus sp. VKM F-4281 (FW-2241)]
MDRLSAADYTSAAGPPEAHQANADATLPRQRGGRQERHPSPDTQLLPQHPPSHRRPSPLLLQSLQNKALSTRTIAERRPPNMAHRKL